jgi:hypothetical protein
MGWLPPFFLKRGAMAPFLRSSAPLLRKKGGKDTKRGEWYQLKYRKHSKSDTSKIPIPKKLLVILWYNSWNFWPTSPYAYRESPYAYTGISLWCVNDLSAHNFIMHTGIPICKFCTNFRRMYTRSPPLCIQGSPFANFVLNFAACTPVPRPYAYRDPHMQ